MLDQGWAPRFLRPVTPKSTWMTLSAPRASSSAPSVPFPRTRAPPRRCGAGRERMHSVSRRVNTPPSTILPANKMKAKSGADQPFVLTRRRPGQHARLDIDVGSDPAPIVPKQHFHVGSCRGARGCGLPLRGRAMRIARSQKWGSILAICSASARDAAGIDPPCSSVSTITLVLPPVHLHAVLHRHRPPPRPRRRTRTTTPTTHRPRAPAATYAP